MSEENDLSPAMQLGDVSFHDGSTIHGGLPNNVGGTRLALHCFAAVALVKEPIIPAMRSYGRM